MSHHIHRLRNGRAMGITGLGDPDATRLVLFCHPAPGVGGFDPDPTVTSTVGVRVVAPDRPGYGASDPAPEAADAMESWMGDLDEYLRSVESNARAISTIDFGRIGVVGWGAGAMYASALAGRYPQLVERLVLAEPTAPTRQRLTGSSTAPDARLENVDSLRGLEGYPGASDRLRFMLDEVDRGSDAGLELDQRVLKDTGWHPLVHDVQAPTLIVSAGASPDARWYRHRISRSKYSTEWPDPSTTVVKAWRQILGFLHPREQPPR